MVLLEDAMTSHEPQTGMVAFFDILGYQQVILNNKIHETAHLISDTLMNIPDVVIKNLSQGEIDVPDDLTQTAKSYINEWHRTLREDIKWLIFSDSILVSLPMAKDLHPLLMFQVGGAFWGVCTLLQRQMFDFGLPLRGAISYGEFFIQERCFAGAPIVNAYQTASKLELSLCVLTRDAEWMPREFMAYVTQSGFEGIRMAVEQTAVEYLVPKKHGVSEPHFVLNWVSSGFGADVKPIGDVRTYVIESFLKHNKSAPPEIYPKIDNTEMFVRYIQTNVPDRAWQSMWLTEEVHAEFRRANLLPDG